MKNAWSLILNETSRESSGTLWSSSNLTFIWSEKLLGTIFIWLYSVQDEYPTIFDAFSSHIWIKTYFIGIRYFFGWFIMLIIGVSKWVTFTIYYLPWICLWRFKTIVDITHSIVYSHAWARSKCIHDPWFWMKHHANHLGHYEVPPIKKGIV